MMGSRSLALAWFSLRTNLRAPGSVGGVLALVAIAALGPVGSYASGRGWGLEPDLLFYGYLTGGLFVLRSGLEQQREGGLATYLRHNFTPPMEHAVGMVLSLLGSWLALTAVMFVVALAASAGDLGAAAWYTSIFGLSLAMLVPFVVMVEAVASFRIPMLVPVLGFIALVIILAMAVGEERTVAILGIRVERGDPASLLGLAGRTLAVAGTGFAAFLAASWGRGHGRRLGGGKVTT
jgi:hypothetical protein